MSKFAALSLAFSLVCTTAVAGTLDRIAESGVMKIGYRSDAVPFSYKDPLGEAAGFTVQLCRLIAAEAKTALGLADLKVEYIEVDAADRFSAVQNGDIDILCGATTVTLTRRELVDFSVLTFITGMGVLYPADGAQGFSELEGKRIGVRDNTTTADSLRKEIESSGFQAELVPVGDHAEGATMVENGELDAYAADRAILIYLFLQSENKDKIKVSERLFTSEPYALAMQRDDADFRLLVDRTLSRVYYSDLIDQIYTASFGDVPASDFLAALYQLNALPE